jgi:2-polyprenyl-3-methyl-5-hydroxy-6-metoxy-1,4-benzoquinol methylase
MKFAVPGLWGDDSDRAWRWLGKHDPYYGVLSGPEYRAENLTAERLDAFFATGRDHVDRVLGLVSRHLGVIGSQSCLDFGCGVGRLVVPLAGRFRSVTAVDISRPMIEEAGRNCERFGVRNVEFLETLDGARGAYDLVHSYIVLQHIPVSRGMAIVDQLIDRVAPDGACFLHFTIGRDAGVLRKIATSLRKNVKPLHYVLNLSEGKHLTDAYMQSNEYNLNRFVAHLYRRNIRRLWLETENHGGPYSVCAAFRAPDH